MIDVGDMMEQDLATAEAGLADLIEWNGTEYPAVCGPGAQGVALLMEGEETTDAMSASVRAELFMGTEPGEGDIIYHPPQFDEHSRAYRIQTVTPCRGRTVLVFACVGVAQ